MQNLALSRTYLEYFKKGVRTLTSRSKSGDAEYGQAYHMSGYKERSIYDGLTQSRPDVEIRRGSYARSDVSRAPLNPRINRKVEIHVSTGDRPPSGDP